MAANNWRHNSTSTSSKTVHPQRQNVFIHSETVAEANLELLRRQKHCDVIFVVGSEKKPIGCHKTFLISRSPVFETMFSERWESSTPIVLPDVELATFQSFLQFVYGDVFTNNIPVAIRVLQLGHKYDVKPLVQNCERLISQNFQLKDAIETFAVARRYSLQNLMDQAGDLMASNFEDLSKQANFRDMDEETLIYLLQKDILYLEELKLFNVVLRWARDNMGENSSYSEVLKNILPLIRFPLMTPQEFATYVYPTQILPQKDVINLFLYFNLEGSVREDAATRIQFSDVPRKKPITLSLYAPTTMSRSAPFQQGYESLEYGEGHEDKLEICYKTRRRGISHKVLRLESLLLEGLNYENLRSYWPSSKTPEPKQEVLVSIEILNSLGTGESIFTGECAISRGEKSILKLCPRIELVPGVKFRVTVKFQGNVLVIKQLGERPGQRQLDLNYDILTACTLKSSLSDSNFTGTLGVAMNGQSSKTNQVGLTWANYHISNQYNGQRALHVVRGLMFSCW